MRSIRVLVCQVGDGTLDLMSELACFDLATPDVAALQPETALDALEATTQEIGTIILRRLLHAQWAESAEFARYLRFLSFSRESPSLPRQHVRRTVPRLRRRR